MLSLPGSQKCRLGSASEEGAGRALREVRFVTAWLRLRVWHAGWRLLVCPGTRGTLPPTAQGPFAAVDIPD